MSSAGILVAPQAECLSPPPQAVTMTTVIVKDFAKSHVVSNSSLTSSSGQSSKQSTAYSHLSSDSTQTPSTSATTDDIMVADSTRMSNVQVLTLHNEDKSPSFGPPPPSPPASFEREIPVESNAEESLSGGIRLVAPTPYVVDAGSPPIPIYPSSAPPSSFVASMSGTPISPSPEARPRPTTLPQPPSRSSSTYAGAPSNAYLQAPSSPHGKHSRVRPTRRNTAPVAVPAGSAYGDTGVSQSPVAGPSSNRFGFGRAVEDGIISDLQLGTSSEEKELATEIQQAAEQIRRERLSKRAKQQAQQAEHDAVEAALSRSDTRRSVGSGKEDAVLVGNLIGEGHVNYVLMYNMLTGIRVGVSRCQAKLKRELTPEDFYAAHKMSFDIMGNELTPSAKYDFKFKDYAPWVFRALREEVFHLDPADYLLSLTKKYILSELGSPGKSGSFFYFSRDYRYIIKTIRHSEHKFLLSILEKYYQHVKTNPHTLLSRFYGLHRVKLPRGRKIHFVIMNNLFPPHRDIHETYDLKGSTVGREYPEEKASSNPRAVKKDLNWINSGNMLELGPEKRALLTEQLKRDAEFLKSINVMDYSLLVGIHNMRRGNKDNLRKNTLKVFSPDIPRPHRRAGSTADAALVRRAMRHSQTKSLGEGKNTIKLPDEDFRGAERSHFVFYQDEGGLRATDEANRPEPTIYYLGIIDILTPWTAVKKLEGLWKGLSADRHKISPVPPAEYSQRFFNFMKAIMRGGEGGEKFKPE